MRWMWITAAAALGLGNPAASQTHANGSAAAASLNARNQIEAVRRATAGYATPEGAKSGGFEPVLGWIPMMGTHWVNGVRMLEGKTVDLMRPSQLMFSAVHGKQTLVGAAFAYLAPVTDSARPAVFDGNPPWHDHPDLAPPGTTVVMLHVWFVDSPDGAFAGLNQYLPFWAAGLNPPAIQRMRDSAVSLTVRKGALALAEVVDTTGLFPVISRRPPVRAVLEERRAAVRLLIPQLDSAEKAGDVTRWDRLASELAAHWEAMREAYLASAVNPAVNARIRSVIDDMLKDGSGHGGHQH